MSQPVDWHKTAMLYDDDAPHQIRIQGGPNERLNWSCTCQPARKANGARRAYKPLGFFAGLAIDAVLELHQGHAAADSATSVGAV